MPAHAAMVSRDGLQDGFELLGGLVCAFLKRRVDRLANGNIQGFGGIIVDGLDHARSPGERQCLRPGHGSKCQNLKRFGINWRNVANRRVHGAYAIVGSFSRRKKIVQVARRRGVISLSVA
jgi:hypothetical protein